MALTKIGKEGITGISNASDATAITITSSELVGIGTISPENKLHIFSGESGGAGSLGLVTIEDDTHAYLQFLTPSSKEQGVLFGDSDNNVGGITYSHVTDALMFTANAAERMRITSAGLVGIGTTSPSSQLHLSTSTAQIDAHGQLKVVQTDTSGGSSTNAGINLMNHYGTSQFMQWEDNGLRIGSRILTNSGNGNVILTTGSDAEAMRLLANGNVGIGVTAPAVKLDVTDESIRMEAAQGGYGNSAGNFHIDSKAGTGGRVYLNWFAGTGGMSVGNGSSGHGVARASAFTVSSDRRLKENISYFNNGLAQILQLKPATFDFINGENNQKGFIAQDVETVIPEVIGTTTMPNSSGEVDETDEYLTINSQAIIPYLVSAIKEQQTTIEALETRLTALEA